MIVLETYVTTKKTLTQAQKRPVQQVHAPTSYDAMLGVGNGHNGERERMGFRDEGGNVVQGQERGRDPYNRGPPPPPPTFIPHNYGPPPPPPTFIPHNYGSPPPPPTFIPHNYGPPPPRSTFIPHNHDPPQNQQLVVRDMNQQLTEKGLERPRPLPPAFIPPPPRRDLSNESGRRTWSPPREVERSPHYHSSDSFGEILFSRRPTTVRLDPHMSNKERALVRRPGGSRPVESYMRERILNDSIRVRGEDITKTPMVVHGRTARMSTPKKTKRQVHNGRQEVPAQNRLHRNKYETSEEEDNAPISNPPRHAGSGANLTDEELILKTLRKFTTFQGEVYPSKSDDIAISSAPATSPYGRRESSVKARRESNDTVRFSWPAVAKERHGRIQDVSPAATADVEKEQKRSWEQNREQESAPDRRFTFYDRNTGAKSDELIAMTGEDENIDVLGPKEAKPPNELAHKSSAAKVASVYRATEPDSFSGPEPNDEISSQLHRRARFRGDEGLARDPAKSLIKRSATEPVSKAKPPISRSATVEDFGPEGED